MTFSLSSFDGTSRLLDYVKLGHK